MPVADGQTSGKSGQRKVPFGSRTSLANLCWLRSRVKPAAHSRLVSAPGPKGGPSPWRKCRASCGFGVRRHDFASPELRSEHDGSHAAVVSVNGPAVFQQRGNDFRVTFERHPARRRLPAVVATMHVRPVPDARRASWRLPRCPCNLPASTGCRPCGQPGSPAGPALRATASASRSAWRILPAGLLHRSAVENGLLFCLYSLEQGTQKPLMASGKNWQITLPT